MPGGALSAIGFRMRWVNRAVCSPYGLSGTVFGADPQRAERVASAIRAGTISINGGVWYRGDTPFGGYKQSGVGRELGLAGFEEYLQMKVIAEAVR